MTSALDLETQLAQLEKARLALLTGTTKVSVSFGAGGASRSITYRPADLAQVNAAIAEIKAQLGRGGRRAIRVSF